MKLAGFLRTNEKKQLTMYMYRLTFIFLILISFSSLNAQMTSRKTTKNGTELQVYLIQKGETLYALSRKFDIPPSQLIKFNPTAENGLQIGQEFYIPLNKKAKPENPEQKTHIVQKGETLYALSRKYGVSPEEIQKLNNLSSSALNIGQTIKIPNGQEEEEEKPAITDEKVAPNLDANQSEYKEITHIVTAGETLFALSQKYDIPASEILKWNNLNSESLSIGQKIMIRKENKTSQPVIETPREEVKENVEITSNQEKKDPISDKTIEKAIVTEKEDKEQTSTQQLPTDKYVEVVEEGVAELIPQSDNTRKYLALHRTVKPGTIIRVRNETNGREVWARVIGNLPDTSENKDILVKISKAAYDRLGALDQRFRVTITYIP